MVLAAEAAPATPTRPAGVTAGEMMIHSEAVFRSCTMLAMANELHVARGQQNRRCAIQFEQPSTAAVTLSSSQDIS